jgi:hypothetical protein
MRSKNEVQQKLELVKYALEYGDIKKKSDFKVLRGQITVLEWILDE